MSSHPSSCVSISPADVAGFGDVALEGGEGYERDGGLGADDEKAIAEFIKFVGVVSLSSLPASSPISLMLVFFKGGSRGI
jgi:hypothetical protein